MRFIGNKEKLVDRIYQVVSATNTNGGSFATSFREHQMLDDTSKKKDLRYCLQIFFIFSYVLQKGVYRKQRRARI